MYNEQMNMALATDYEVIIIGGSFAGLSAGMTLGRAIRKTLIIDSGKPCNQQTPYSHNFITHDGEPPAVIAQEAQTQVLAYDTVSVIHDLVTQVAYQGQHFVASTQQGSTYTSQKLIFATGVKDIMPEITGFAACWGISALHCPYCHGYEARGKKTGILINNDTVVEFARLIKHWTPQLTIFTNGPAQFDKEALTPFNVNVVEQYIDQLPHENGKLSALEFEDGSSYAIEVLYHRPTFVQHSNIPEKLGCNLTDSGHIQVNAQQKTNVDGIYAVGDCTTFFRSVATAVAQGNVGAAMLNHELIEEV